MRVNFDVLMILDALDRHGSFATAAESLYKTPAALSYMIQKLESDLNIVLLDRSGHRASFRFSALLPLIAEIYAPNPQTRLNFSHHTLAGSWEELTHHGADIILGAINEPPTSAEWSWQTLGALDNIFVVAPHHPLAQAKEPLANKQLSQHRAIVIRDSARYCHPLNSNLLDEQPQIGVDDFASKVELLCAGLGCGFLPRHIARPWLVKGSLVEKSVACWREKDITYMAWRSGNDGLAQRWWREVLLRGDLLSQLYH